ncbi:MAG: adenylyl-sulfate kinase [Rhodospirillales bacterium]|jgi:cytidine diphosphoramidate kinase
MVIWLIGLAGSGKTTIGRQLYAALKTRTNSTVFLDGDQFRAIMGNDLGHSFDDRRRNGERMLQLCAFLDAQNIDVVCCILSIFPEHRLVCRQTFSCYAEIYIDVSMEELIRRDQKGLYTGALAGRVKNVIGIDLPFVPPENPDLIIDNSKARNDFSSTVNDILSVIERTKRT